MKFVIVALCCIVGYCVGLFFQKKSLQKLQFYYVWHNYILALRNNLNGKCLSILQFHNEFCVDGKSTDFCACLKKNSAPKFLDEASLLQFHALETLPLNNSRQQMLEKLDEMQSFVAQMLADLQKQSAKQKSVYCQVGFMFGFLVGMLFV